METLTTASIVREKQVMFLLMVANATSMDCDEVGMKLESKSDHYISFMFEIVGQWCETCTDKTEMEEDLNFLLAYDDVLTATFAKMAKNKSEENIRVAKRQAFVEMSEDEIIKSCIDSLSKYGLVSLDTSTFDELSDKCSLNRTYFNVIAYCLNEICNDGKHDKEEVALKYGWLISSNTDAEATAKAKEYIAANNIA